MVEWTASGCTNKSTWFATMVKFPCCLEGFFLSPRLKSVEEVRGRKPGLSARFRSVSCLCISLPHTQTSSSALRNFTKTRSRKLWKMNTRWTKIDPPLRFVFLFGNTMAAETQEVADRRIRKHLHMPTSGLSRVVRTLMIVQHPSFLCEYKYQASCNKVLLHYYCHMHILQSRRRTICYALITFLVKTLAQGEP